MRVTILGCGPSTGVPTLGGPDGRGDWGACDPAEPRNRRSRSAIVIHAPAGNILVDAGPDLRAQMLACGIGRVGGVVFTHAHADHINGLDDVRMLNRIAGTPLPAWCTGETLAELRRRFDYTFRAWKGPQFFWPVLEYETIVPGEPVTILGTRFETFDQPHYGQRTLSLRAGGFAYTTDVADLEEGAFARLAGLDTWVVGCLQRGPHPAHAHLERVLGWCARLRPRRVVFTHMGLDLDWGWMRANLPAGVEPAYDGMVLDVPEAA